MIRDITAMRCLLEWLDSHKTCEINPKSGTVCVNLKSRYTTLYHWWYRYNWMSPQCCNTNCHASCEQGTTIWLLVVERQVPITTPLHRTAPKLLLSLRHLSLSPLMIWTRDLTPAHVLKTMPDLWTMMEWRTVTQVTTSRSQRIHHSVYFL